MWIVIQSLDDLIEELTLIKKKIEMHWKATTVTLVSIFMSAVPRPLGGHQGLEVLSTTYKGGWLEALGAWLVIIVQHLENANLCGQLYFYT